MPESTSPPPASEGRWTSLWVVALLSLIAQLWMCQFFSFGQNVPTTLDVNPSNLWKYAYHFPPQGTFLVLNWLGLPYLPVPLNPFGLGATLPAWLFFTTYVPIMGTCALLAMAAFLRELEISRPAALFGALVYAWQGDLLPFIFPGHFPYIATWPLFALSAWAALRAQRTRDWPYAVISGACCGVMIGLQPDRGAIASLLIAALYITSALRSKNESWLHLRHLVLCAGVALLVSFAAFLALFQSNIVGVKLGGLGDREKTFEMVTQFSLPPDETYTYLVPGFFGWHSSHSEGQYWGGIGQSMDWIRAQKMGLGNRGTRNLNLAISTTGTVATVIAIFGAFLLIPGRILGPDTLVPRQRLYGQVLLVMGLIGLVLSWGWHTPLYRPLFALPLMDKWRNPLKWLEYTNFAIAVLSAYGLQHLITSLAADTAVIRRRLFWAMLGFLVFLGGAFLLSYPITLVLRPLLIARGYDYMATANIISTIHISSLVAFLLMALFCAILRFLWQPARLRQISIVNPMLDRLWQDMLSPRHLPLTFALSLGLLVVVQMGWVAGQFIYPNRLSALTSTIPLLDFLRAQGDTVRVSVDPSDPNLNVLLQNQFTGQHISCLEISAASRIPDLTGTFLETLSDDRARLWFLSGVKNVAVPQQVVPQLQHDPRIATNIVDAGGYMLEPTADGMPTHAVVQLRDYLGKATFIPHAEVIPDETKLLERLKNPNWNPRDTILLAGEPPAPPPAATPTTDIPKDPQIALHSYTPTEIVVDVIVAQPGYLLINDQYDPDWKTDVNGHPMPLLRADYIFRAVPIPAGYSTITMRYIAHYRLAGLNLNATAVNLFSDAALLISLLLAAWALWSRRQSGGLPAH